MSMSEMFETEEERRRWKQPSPETNKPPKERKMDYINQGQANVYQGSLQGSLQPAASQEKGSRIDSDIANLQAMVQRVRNCELRIVRHARTLGYYQPQPESPSVKPTPVMSTMADMLSDMDRAVDGLNGSLNLFD